MVVCVWLWGGGGGEAISKLKGAGATHALPRSYLHVSILLFASFHIIICAAHRRSRPEIIGRHLRASN